MRYGKSQNKVMVIAILLTIITISVGFAAFSSSLRIKSKLSVNPTDSTFNVVFSSSSSAIETNDIKPTVSGTNSTNIVASNATIKNTGTYPTISGLYATLTEKGQSVTYTFYSRNAGQHLAYLTSIVFQELASGSFIECTADSGTTQSLVTQACEDIDVSVKVGSDAAVTSTTLGISNHKLNINTSEVVTVTLSYNSDVLVDGSFEVKMGDIYLTYGTQMTSDSPTLPRAICSLTDANSNSTADVGEMVTCGSEKFYVIKNNTTTLAMLAEKNITISTTNPRQSDTAGKTKFSDEEYWWYSDDELQDYFYRDGYPIKTYEDEYFYGWGFIYDSNSNLYQYVEAYEDYLQSIGVNSADATLLDTSYLVQFGCNGGDFCAWVSGVPSWVYSTEYWFGDAGKGSPYIIDSTLIEESWLRTATTSGIRPLVIISVDELV